VTTAVPQDTDPDDEFGFAETITEWPNITWKNWMKNYLKH
jgi:hypothetical protein